MRLLISLLVLIFLGLPSAAFAQTPITKPVPSPDSESVLPKTVIINPDPTKCYPTSCTTIKLEKQGPTTVVNDGEIKVTTTLPLDSEDNKLKIEKDGKRETIISPSGAVSVVETVSLQRGALPTKVSKIGLNKCKPKPGPKPPCEDGSPVYEVETEKDAKFLNLIPIKVKINYQIDATNKKILVERKPWYLYVASVLFRF